MGKDIRLWAVFDEDRNDVLFASVSQSATRSVLQRSMASMPFGKFTLLRFDLCPLYRDLTCARSQAPAGVWIHEEPKKNNRIQNKRK